MPNTTKAIGPSPPPRIPSGKSPQSSPSSPPQAASSFCPGDHLVDRIAKHVTIPIPRKRLGRIGAAVQTIRGHESSHFSVLLSFRSLFDFGHAQSLAGDVAGSRVAEHVSVKVVVEFCACPGASIWPIDGYWMAVSRPAEYWE
jgi:hypothetical protein